MSNGKHTPGPWQDNGINGPVAFRQACAVWSKRDGDDVFIASVAPDMFHDWQPSEEEQDANARLIAAAPDLLKACESLLTLSLPHDVSGQRMVEAARESVAKAKGSN